jgi:hypothetical protein
MTMPPIISSVKGHYQTMCLLKINLVLFSASKSHPELVEGRLLRPFEPKSRSESS